MQLSGDTFETAITILQLRGTLESNAAPRYLRNVYRDDKVEITAYLDTQDQLIKEVSIWLFLPDPDNSRPPDPASRLGGIPNKNAVRVFTWDRFVRQFRPGRWTTYLRTIARRAIAESTSTQLKQLGDEPIDDSLLFPDIHL